MSDLIYTLINKETPLCDFIIEGEGEKEFYCKNYLSSCVFYNG
jgi:hypothetical protein